MSTDEMRDKRTERWTIEACPQCLARIDEEPNGCDYCENGGHLEHIPVVPARLLDTAWDALREIEAALRVRTTDHRKLGIIAGVVSNGPLDTAPGGPREYECERLRPSCAGCERELSAVRLDLISALGQAQEHEAENGRLRDALERVLGICDDAASDACDCDGYYKCGTCPGRISSRAEDAVEVARDALSATTHKGADAEC